MMQAGERTENDMTKSELHNLIVYLQKLGFDEKQILNLLLEITK